MTKASKKRANARKAALKKKQSEETKKVSVPSNLVTEELSKNINTYVKPPESSTKSPSTDTKVSEDPNTYDRPPDLNDNSSSLF